MDLQKFALMVAAVVAGQYAYENFVRSAIGAPVGGK